ncbi:MAG: hypothetical protein ACXAAH_06315, partial [Promethearchaeota archaeon]
MGKNITEKVKVSIKDDKKVLDKEKKKKEFNEISKIDKKNNTKDDYLRNSDNDNKIIKRTQEEKKESKWSK